ncbi:MAG: SDR family oxidoreductase [Proteobacteria bacterium]|nr:SDR family oxidoreductase [Pseudomonadota bacterium]
MSARVALVTGASSGFGAAIARALGALGWSVALGARRLDKLQEVALDVEKAGGVPFVGALDVRELESIDGFFAAAEEALGPLDTVVSNAGVGAPNRLHETSPEDLREELDTNLMGALLVARRAIPSMLARRRGDLVFVSSLNAVQPRPFQAGYTASKAGVEGLARSLQMELEGTGVRATIVRPGASRTEMGRDWSAEVVGPMLASWKHWGVLRHHRYLVPESIAAAVVSAVTAPPGTHLDLIQVNPEAPLLEPTPNGEPEPGD